MIIEWYRELFLFLWKYLGFFGGIVGISVIVSLACFPIYNVIGRMVGMENALQSVLTPAIAKIKETFSDAAERQSAIERLYARFGYHPIMGVRKVLPLFVSIPFLMLTYYMLAGTSELEGVKWLCFNDLSKPDGMLFGFNLLPFVMTGVNLLTVYATPCFNKKDEVQAWVIAIFFLVLLYSANTALMIYWTLNQIFNFLRTLFENKGSGFTLLCKRIKSLRAMPSSLVRLLRGGVGVQASFAFALLSVYLHTLIFAYSDFAQCFTTSVCNLGRIVLAIFALVLTKRGKDSYGCATIIGGLTAYEFAAYRFVVPHVAFISYDYIFYLAVVLWIVLNLDMRISRNLKNIKVAFSENWFLLLVPAAIALHYASANVDFSFTFQSKMVLIAYVLLPLVAVGAVMASLLCARLTPIVSFQIICAVAIGIWIVPMISTANGLLNHESNIFIRLILVAIIVVGLRLLMKYKKRFVLVFSCLVFVGEISSEAINSFSGQPVCVSGQKFDSLDKTPFSNVVCQHTPNIYFLVYDGYPTPVILDALHISRGDVDAYLENAGFKVYPECYSVGSDTLDSMSAVFSIGGIAYGSKRSTKSGNNVFCDILKKAGYKTSYLVGAYSMPMRGERLPGDYYFPTPSKVKKPENVIFACMMRGCMTHSPNTFNDFTQEEWNAKKDFVLNGIGADREFVYAHPDLPGHLSVDRRLRQSDVAEQSEFQTRINKANIAIKHDIDLILNRKYDTNSVIIVAGDHGGVLIHPEDDLKYDTPAYALDRFGMYLAIRWPKGESNLHTDIRCLQDVLPEVLAYLSGERVEDFRIDRTTYPTGGDWAGIEEGYVKDGVIQKGPWAGESIFEAAKKSLQRDSK